MSDSRQTEFIDKGFRDLDLRSSGDILAILYESQQTATIAVNRALPTIESAVDAAAGRLTGQGRLVLCGAGASGRLAVQDGAELWPTYGWPSERLILAMAGGFEALVNSIEGVEDDETAAEREVESHGIDSGDVVVALAASGTSPWTCAWLRAARRRGALSVGVANNAPSALLDVAEFGIHLDSGAEVLAGSTRMAAGTAQKIFLNLFSTTLMIRLNRTYGNLMVDMAVTNAKLAQRKLRLIEAVLPDVDSDTARTALDAAEGWVKLAVVIACGIEKSEGKRLLDSNDGSLRAVLAHIQRNH